MITTILICILLTAGYALLMSAYRLGWKRQKEFVLPPDYAPCTFITVIVPARNEKTNIGACIESLLDQRYPADLFEIIVVDDHSDDGTADVVREYRAANLACISLADHLNPEKQTIAFKKAAIAAGVGQSKGTLIVTTDADCTAPNAWLLHIAAIYERDMPVMVVAPVIFSCDDSILQIFQTIDFLGMQGITAAAHNMALGNMSNGANLAFRKTAFDQAGGYAGIDHLASGDDYLLMMKLNLQTPGNIVYLKSEHAIVTTSPQPDWRGFIRQRIRWSSKSGKYNDRRLTAILIMVYLFNLAFPVLIIAGFFEQDFFYIACSMLFVKVIFEGRLLIPVSRFFDDEWVMRFFFLLQPLHIIYIIIAGFFGLIGTYEWKGRKVK